MMSTSKSGLPARRLRRLAPVLVAISLTLVPLPGPVQAKSRGASHRMLIGALLSLTGSWSTVGQASKAVLEIGAEEFNDESIAVRSRMRVQVMVQDTKLEPPRALAALKKLAARGVRVVVGPQSSSEVTAINDYANRHGILVISQGSTAGNLAIEGDNIFRFCPNDRKEGTAAAALMYHRGIRVVVPVWRADDGNQGHHDAIETFFPALGGTVLPGVRYTEDTTDFAPVVAALSEQVAQAVAQSGAAQVAVYHAGFDETVGLFNAATPDPVLGSVLWVGADGTSQNQALLGNEVAARFAARVDYPCPAFGLDELARPLWEPLSNRVRQKVGFTPDAFALASYDALWVAASAQRQIGVGARDINRRRRAFVATANRFWGATGWTELEASGDREIGNFDFFGIREVDGVLQWQRVVQYANGQIFE